MFIAVTNLTLFSLYIQPSLDRFLWVEWKGLTHRGSFLRERERERERERGHAHASGEEAEGKGERESQAGCTHSAEPNKGLHLGESMT